MAYNKTITEKLDKPLIVVVGPTASGKIELAVKIAKKFSGEIISADSRQVYKKLNIGTGKITKSEMENIPHHMLDVASPQKDFSVAEYQKLALAKIKNILHKNKIPILCGGTGFYIQAVIDGIIFPNVPPNPEIRKNLGDKKAEELFQKLLKLDPSRAQTIDPKNPRRLIRAIEIAEKIGKVPKIKKISLDMKAIFVGIKKPPEELRELIQKRLKKRFEAGMVEEVKNLHEKQKLSWRRLESLGLEYRYLAEFLQGMITRKEMELILERKIWQYSKRQMTWFKKDKRIKWTKDYKEAENVIMKEIENKNFIKINLT